MEQRERNRLELEHWLTERGMGERVADRIRRLNPNPDPCMALRGYYAHIGKPELWRGRFISRGAFVREFGCEAYAVLPRHAILKFGRRRFVKAQARYEWELYAGKRRCDAMAVSIPEHAKRFANDLPTMEVIMWAEFARRQGLPPDAGD